MRDSTVKTEDKKKISSHEQINNVAMTTVGS